MTREEFAKLCTDLEHFETPRWCVDEILKREIMTRYVLDPCCGTGVLAQAARDAGYVVTSYDVQDWGFPGTHVVDFMQLDPSEHHEDRAFTVLMNPPFSKAEEFVLKCFELGARKVLCFQRFAWWESSRRAGFWSQTPPNRIYICGSRATCWRHDIPVAERERTADGKKRGGTSTAHAWFVWERGNPPGTVLGHIYKGDDRHAA